ncbi:AlpA family phage regulatory protein [Mesorhizobium sp. M0184]|uniref:helix-turn-helix transcriptional regulator n=1 Tax=unclassified Mesorhizobium TaxID=325217 RepID=UPI003334F08B
MELDRNLRIEQVIEITTLSRTEIYRRIKAGLFPSQKRVSHKVAVWRASEIKAWHEAIFGA